MSGVTLSLTKTSNGFKTLFGELKEKLNERNFDLLLDVIGASLTSDLTDRFDKGVAPDGTPWVMSQRALDENSKTLIDTRILAMSFTHEAANGSLLVGTNEVYGAIHHFGGEAGRNKSVTLPARPILGIAAQQKAMINTIWTGWL